MVFAPAMGIAAFKVIGWLSFVIAILLSLLGLRQYFAPNDGMAASSAFFQAAMFSAGGLACFWLAKFVQRIASDE